MYLHSGPHRCNVGTSENPRTAAPSLWTGEGTAFSRLDAADCFFIYSCRSKPVPATDAGHAAVLVAELFVCVTPGAVGKEKDSELVGAAEVALSGLVPEGLISGSYKLAPGRKPRSQPPRLRRLPRARAEPGQQGHPGDVLPSMCAAPLPPFPAAL